MLGGFQERNNQSFYRGTGLILLTSTTVLFVIPFRFETDRDGAWSRMTDATERSMTPARMGFQINSQVRLRYWDPIVIHWNIGVPHLPSHRQTTVQTLSDQHFPVQLSRPTWEFNQINGPIPLTLVETDLTDSRWLHRTYGTNMEECGEDRRRWRSIYLEMKMRDGPSPIKTQWHTVMTTAPMCDGTSR